MRSHSELGAPDKEPWSFDWEHEAINKRAIELRYQLLPYLYNVMHQASETGVPAMRPLFLEFPGDEGTAAIDDEFLFGADLLVAPVLWEGATEREIYLPKCDWYDYWTGRRYQGGGVIHVPVTLDSLPLFVRGGAFIFREPVVQDTDEIPGKPLRILVAPAQHSESTLYEDDGETLNYRRGDFLKRRFRQVSDNASTTIDISEPEGTYRPAPRDLIFEAWRDREPKSVSVNPLKNPEKTLMLPRLDTAAFGSASSGWCYQDGVVNVKENDRFIAERFVIQR
jgi:alpha-glucosidase